MVTGAMRSSKTFLRVVSVYHLPISEVVGRMQFRLAMSRHGFGTLVIVTFTKVRMVSTLVSFVNGTNEERHRRGTLLKAMT